jgi:hypothetical protein
LRITLRLRDAERAVKRCAEHVPDRR